MLYKSFYCVAKIPFPFYCKPACVIYKVPDRITCQLTSALLEEHEEAVGEKPLRMKSSWLLSDMRKLRNSTKESDPRLLENHKLQADVKLSYVDVKLKALHPVLRLEEHLDMISRENRLDILCGGQDLFAATQLFWDRFEGENPELVSKLRAEKGDLSTCVPLALCCVWRRGSVSQESCFPCLCFAARHRAWHLLHKSGRQPSKRPRIERAWSELSHSLCVLCDASLMLQQEP